MLPLLVQPGHRLRPAIEDTIRQVYRANYGADLPGFPQHVLAMVEGSGVLAAAGLRFGDFFSERYLDEPVEDVLARLARRPVARAGIVEVTTLAAARPGHALPLIAEIVALARARGIEWAFFTLTARLRATLRRWGVPVLDLGPARPERLPDAAAWGRYYESQPRVCAVHDAMVAVGAPPAAAVANG